MSPRPLPGFPSLPLQSARSDVLPAVSLTAPLAVAVWVYDDARDRGSGHPVAWAVATALVPFVLPVYLLFVGLGRLAPLASPARHA